MLATRDPRASQVRSALAALCEAYWRPVYSFIRHSGYLHEDARDLTQAFFARMLEKGSFRDATPERGRFRAFLLGSVRHFLANERDREHAVKRGGAQVLVSLDDSDEERQYALHLAAGATPDEIYASRWAWAVLDQTTRRLRATHTQRGRETQFDRLRPFLIGDEPDSYARLAREVGVSEGALRVAVHRLRRQFAECLRGIIAETVERPEEIDDELRFLVAAAGR